MPMQRNVTVSMFADNGFIQLVVKDDGNGFQIGKLSSGNGLKNMQQRAGFLLKGKLKIITAPGAGTAIELSFKALKSFYEHGLRSCLNSIFCKHLYKKIELTYANFSEPHRRINQDKALSFFGGSVPSGTKYR